MSCNAFKVYEKLDSYDPSSMEDFLNAHKTLMTGLIDNAGKLRRGVVGIARGDEVIHTAPPADRVLFLVKNLLEWLRKTDDHPLVTSSVLHYELEFIHPFMDGNGRMGRLWQTLILSKWNTVFAYLPIESVIYEQQEEYYRVLGLCDNKGDSTSFVEFLLRTILDTLKNIAFTDQVADQAADQVKALLKALNGGGSISAVNLMQKLKLSHRPTFRENYLHPALKDSLIEMTIPGKPNSCFQKYRITERGWALLQVIGIGNNKEPQQ